MHGIVLGEIFSRRVGGSGVVGTNVHAECVRVRSGTGLGDPVEAVGAAGACQYEQKSPFLHVPLRISSTRRGVTGDMGVGGDVRGEQSHSREIESPVKNRMLRACARNNEHGVCKEFVSALEEEA